MTSDLRISREQAFMKIAEVWAQRSTCMRRNVGAVIVHDRRIISHGYNGAPSGEPHCNGIGCVPEGQTGCTKAVHAEANAILYMPLGSENIKDKIMFTTESPCPQCAKLIIYNGFESVYYLNEYRLVDGINHLLNRNIKVFRMTPAGMLMQKTGQASFEEIKRS